MTTPSDPVHLRVRTDAHPNAVYKALTDADLIIEWLAESAEVDLEAGRYEFWGRYTPLGDRARQQLQGAEPDRSLRFGWDLGETADAPSVVEVTLAEHGDGGTEVRVSHTGIPVAQRLALDCFWPVSLANLAAQAEGLQTMPPFDFSAPAQEAALARTVIDVPPEEVYAFLLDPQQVGAWIGGAASIEPQLGGAYRFTWPRGAGSGPTEIVELEPDKTLGYAWQAAGGSATTVRWQLRGVRGSTYLTLLHEGFSDDALAEEYRLGWPPYLVELKRRLELGPRFEPLRA